MLSNLCQKVLDEFASLNTKYGPSMSTRSNLKSFVFEGQKFPGMSNDINLEGNGRSTSVWPSTLIIFNFFDWFRRPPFFFFQTTWPNTCASTITF